MNHRTYFIMLYISPIISMKVNKTVGSTGLLITRSLFCLTHIYVTSAVMIMVFNATFSNI